MIVFFDITRADLESKLVNLKSALKDIKIDNSPEVRITMSFGAAYGTELVNNLIGVADKALYESKKTRDTYTVITT
jgi:c-di-AMP phosphodiesterase-like protein